MMFCASHDCSSSQFNYFCFFYVITLVPILLLCLQGGTGVWEIPDTSLKSYCTQPIRLLFGNNIAPTHFSLFQFLLLFQKKFVFDDFFCSSHHLLHNSVVGFFSSRLLFRFSHFVSRDTLYRRYLVSNGGKMPLKPTILRKRFSCGSSFSR